MLKVIFENNVLLKYKTEFNVPPYVCNQKIVCLTKQAIIKNKFFKYRIENNRTSGESAE